METDNRRALGILVCLMALSAFGCGSRRSNVGTANDSGINCAAVGCAAPPLCSERCHAACGCCPCAAGARNGALICTDQGCYAPLPNAGDGGQDASGDASRDSGDDASTDGNNDAADGAWTPGVACGLAFDPGPCEAAITVYAFADGACATRTYGGCQGNANRFVTLEECLATCEGR